MAILRGASRSSRSGRGRGRLQHSQPAEAKPEPLAVGAVALRDGRIRRGPLEHALVAAEQGSKALVHDEHGHASRSAPRLLIAAIATPAAAAAPRKSRKREKRNVNTGVVHIKSTFNNTIVSITDASGNVIAWASSGGVGFSGSRKSTPFAAQMAAEKAGRAAMELGLRRAEVLVKGPGSGRDTALRSIQNLGIEVTGIKDVSPVPHNGCRLPKRKRP